MFITCRLLDNVRQMVYWPSTKHLLFYRPMNQRGFRSTQQCIMIVNMANICSARAAS
jgi:hypothetical protein